MPNMVVFQSVRFGINNDLLQDCKNSNRPIEIIRNFFYNRDPMKIGILKKYLYLSLTYLDFLMGIIFRLVTPFFVQFLSETLSYLFTALCLSAGLMVGLFSYFIGKQSLLKTILEIGKFSTKLANGDFTY
jgi:hypothetical protein